MLTKFRYYLKIDMKMSASVTLIPHSNIIYKIQQKKICGNV